MSCCTRSFSEPAITIPRSLNNRNGRRAVISRCQEPMTVGDDVLLMIFTPRYHVNALATNTSSPAVAFMHLQRFSYGQPRLHHERDTSAPANLWATCQSSQLPTNSSDIAPMTSVHRKPLLSSHSIRTSIGRTATAAWLESSTALLPMAGC